MKIVNFYNKTNKVYSVYANSLEEVQAKPNLYYEDYKEGINITDMDFVHPILDGAELRESTREELIAKGIEIPLQEGEIIKEKKLIVLEKPSKYHAWNGKKWSVDLQEVKQLKREELKKIREEKIEENIEVKKDLFQVRKGDLDNFYNLKIAMDLDSKMKSQKVKWILADNTIKEFTYVDLMGVLSAYMLRKQNLFLKFAEVSYKLEQCKTVEEIEQISW